MPCSTILALRDIQRPLPQVDVHAAQASYLSESQPALQAYERHQPNLMAAALQFGKKGARLCRLKEAFAPVVELRQRDTLERHFSRVQCPCRHSAHDPADQTYHVADGLGGKSLRRQTAHEPVQSIGGDVLQQGLPEDRADVRIVHPLIGLVSLASGHHPVVPVLFPGTVQCKASLRASALRRLSSAYGFGLGYQPKSFLMRIGGRHALAGPADIPPYSFALSVTIVDGKADIGSAVVTPLRAFPSLHSLISSGLAAFFLATILRPFCDHSATLSVSVPMPARSGNNCIFNMICTYGAVYASMATISTSFGSRGSLVRIQSLRPERQIKEAGYSKM